GRSATSPDAGTRCTARRYSIRGAALQRQSGTGPISSQRAEGHSGRSGPSQTELLLEQADVLGRAHAVLHEAQPAVRVDREGGADGALHDPPVHVLLAPGPVGAHDLVGLVGGEV